MTENLKSMGHFQIKNQDRINIFIERYQSETIHLHKKLHFSTTMPKKRSKNNEATNANLKKRANPGKSQAASNVGRSAPGKNPDKNSNFRSNAKIKLLNMYNEKPDEKARHKQKAGPARIEPDRKWYGNVRTIDQKNLEKFRVEMAMHSNDPYQVLIKAKKLPMSLIKEPTKNAKVHILDFEKFEHTFGKKASRTRAKMSEFTMEGLAT